MNKIMITGVSGHVGGAVLKYLQGFEAEIYLGVRNVEKYKDRFRGVIIRELDFENQETYVTALKDLDKVFLVRPPQITDVEGIFQPFIQSCKEAGVKHIVFLSLIGIEKNPIPPHHKIEKLIVGSSIPYTFIRPSFFMQNLIEPHGDDIIKYNELFIPAGKAKTNFIDTEDIGEIISRVLVSEEHKNRAYDITGSEIITYNQVALIMTKILGRTITYSKPSILKFYRHMRKRAYPKAQIFVMIFLYISTRLGMAKAYSDQAEKLLGRKPHTMEEFIVKNQQVWQ